MQRLVIGVDENAPGKISQALHREVQEAMDWGLTLSQMEGIIPAIETAHAFAVLDVRKFSPEEVIVFNCSGRGDKDLDTYIDYFKL